MEHRLPLRQGLCAVIAALCLATGIENVLAETRAERQVAPGIEGELPDVREIARRVAAVLEDVEYISVPPGEFQMGCPARESECAADETPAHRVTITRGFEIARHEVTQKVWEAVMGRNPSTFRGAERPVEQVSWNDVQEFLAVLNGLGDGYRYRLPTEAEWEYAARAGTTGPYYEELDAIAWYARNSGNQTHPVGRKQPNAWGLYDMQGNVWEWCQDWYKDDYYDEFSKDPAVDPLGPSRGEYRVLRGGSWYRFLWFLRVSSRFGFRPSGRFPHIGFRCVRQKSGLSLVGLGTSHRS